MVAEDFILAVSGYNALDANRLRTLKGAATTTNPQNRVYRTASKSLLYEHGQQVLLKPYDSRIVLPLDSPNLPQGL